MKYLFFDEESIGPKGKTARPFSYGYVLTDEEFNVLEEDNFMFNPHVSKEELDGYALGKIVKKKYSDIDTLPLTFNSYYTTIKRLMSDKNTICIGYAINNDIKYLFNACKYYNKPSINFEYIDVVDIFKKIKKYTPQALEQEYMEMTQHQTIDAHNSDYDAKMTVELLKGLLKEGKTKLIDLIEKEKIKGIVRDFSYGYVNKNLKEYNITDEDVKRNNQKYRNIKQGQEDWILKGTKNDIMFIRFLDHVKPNQNCEQIFKDKKISVSLNYEGYNFTNMIKLVQLITNAGGTYVKKASLSNIFVKDPNCFDDDGNIKRCSKLEYVNEAISSNGAKIEIMEFDDFLKLLNLNIEQLNELSPIDLTYLENEKYAR